MIEIPNSNIFYLPDHDNFYHNGYKPYSQQPLCFYLPVESNCNLNCYYCMNQAHSLEHMPYEACLAALDSISKWAPARLVVTGGEPTLHRDIDTILEYAHAKGFQTVLATNATAPELSWEKLSRTVQWLDVSLPTCNRETYKQIRGHDLVGQVLENTASAIERGIRVRVNILLLPETISSLSQTIEYAKRIGARIVRLCYEIPYDSETPSRPRPISWEHLRKLKERHEDSAFRLIVPKSPATTLSKGYLLVNSHGSLYHFDDGGQSVILGKTTGSLNSESIKDSIAHQLAMFRVSAIEKCISTDLSQPETPGSPASANHCVFCDIVNSDYRSLPCHDRPIIETDSFVVIPALGQFVEGYLLILPKKHVLNMGLLNSSETNEFFSLKKEISDLLRTAYGKRPIFFEHGPTIEGTNGANCIDHAHLHAIPVSLNTSPDLNGDAAIRSITGFEKVRELSRLKSTTSYFYFECSDGSMYLSKSPDLPCQYGRRIIATHLGLKDEWNWSEFPYFDRLEKTVRRISSIYTSRKRTYPMSPILTLPPSVTSGTG